MATLEALVESKMMEATEQKCKSKGQGQDWWLILTSQ